MPEPNGPETSEPPSPDDPWYCRACLSERGLVKTKYSGVFAPLLARVDRENAAIYALPADIRNYFKGGTCGTGV